MIYLGHAGWWISTDKYDLLMDPWLSEKGAFWGSWFQWPPNDFLAEKVLAETGQRPLYVFLSHQHEDHFDADFLLRLQNPRFLIPKFSKLQGKLCALGFTQVSTFLEGEQFSFPETQDFLRFYLDESSLDSDSAIFYQGKDFNFLNLNDCKLFDRLPSLELPPLDIYTVQFSGATWHPVCYEFPLEERERISRSKRLAKFNTVKKSIETLRPRFFVPSSGPAVFLHPDLYGYNFEKESTFPKAEEFLQYLKDEKAAPGTLQELIYPGSQYKNKHWEHQHQPESIEQYQKRKSAFLPRSHSSPADVMDRLEKVLVSKLAHFKTKLKTDFMVYFGAEEGADTLAIDLNRGHLKRVQKSEIREKNSYRIFSKSFVLEALAKGEMSWESFALSFFHKVKRVPDRYDHLVTIFFFSEEKDLAENLRKTEFLRFHQEKMRVVDQGITYECNRYCPHEGADLKDAKIENGALVCPRHNWRFLLASGGEAERGGGSICSKKC